ncbi:MAG: hypothetical protein ACR2PR_01685 [Pseudohongiellaceae bacterium]
MNKRPGKYPISAQVATAHGEQLEAIVAHQIKKGDSRASKTSVIEQMIAREHKRLKL